MSPRCVRPTFSAMRSHSVSLGARLVCTMLSEPRLCTPMMHLCCGASQTVFTGMRQNKVDRRRKLVDHSR